MVLGFPLNTLHLKSRGFFPLFPWVSLSSQWSICLPCVSKWNVQWYNQPLFIIQVPQNLMQVIKELHLLIIAVSCFQAFRNSKEVMDRFIRAYKLMLGFYGINLVNEETGELERAENWRERFENLNRWVSTQVLMLLTLTAARHFFEGEKKVKA